MWENYLEYSPKHQRGGKQEGHIDIYEGWMRRCSINQIRDPEKMKEWMGAGQVANK